MSYKKWIIGLVKKVIIEGDAKIIIEALKNLLEEVPNKIRNYIAECKELLKNFESFIIQHVYKSKNNVTHLVSLKR